MQRDVSAAIWLKASGPARVALAVAAAEGYDVRESFTATSGGEPLPVRVLGDAHGGRLHLLDLDGGEARIEYRATVVGVAAPPAVEPIDRWRYLRPSRYCESDTLRPVALAEFGGLDGTGLLDAVSSWVGVHVAYVPGSSQPTDGAVATLLSRSGVCRDFAHLVVALLRALDVPARVAAVYAPGLAPMDFHAVAEALIDGAWQVVDATALAPRDALVRIATGRDAADVAFLTTHGADVDLLGMEVTAIADVLPADDAGRPAVLR